MFSSSLDAREGALLSYGPDVREFNRHGGVYWPHSEGQKAADLPVVQPTKFEFVINLKTAKALGLNLSPTCWRSPTR
jgi:putative ABC transport system substrate-binding protein